MTEFSTHLLEFDGLVRDLRRKGFIQETLADRCFVLKGEPGAFQDAQHDIGLCITGLIHGNEYGGLGVINRLLLSVLNGTVRPLFPVGIALGNVPAAFEELRFTEKDLNRVFTNKDGNSYEERRSRELEPLIRRARFYIDLHQTIEPTKSPFFILGFHEESLQFANELDPELPVVTYNMQDRVENGMTSTGLSMSNGGIALTLELGQKGFGPDQLICGYEVVTRAVDLLNQSHQKIRSSVRRILESAISEDQSVFYFANKFENTSGVADLVPGLNNFHPVRQGQRIGQDGRQELLAPLDGFVLFPKYGRAKVGTKELCVILQSTTVKSYKQQNVV